MALTGYKIVQATNITQLKALVDAEIAADNSPLGAPGLVLANEYPEKWLFSQAIAVGVDTVTAYNILSGKKPAELATAVTTAIGDSFKLMGGVLVQHSEENGSKAQYFQTVYKGTPADAGYAGTGGAVPAHVHAAADITSGVIADARLPLSDPGVFGLVRPGSGVTINDGIMTVP